MIGVVFKGAVFVQINSCDERPCECPCIAAGHCATCQQLIPVEQPFYLALIERPVAMLRPLGTARACYRDQIRLCEPCALAVRAPQRDGIPDPYTPDGYWVALEAGDWKTVREVNETIGERLIDEAIELEARARGKRYEAVSLRAMIATPFPRPAREGEPSLDEGAGGSSVDWVSRNSARGRGGVPPDR